MSTKIIRTTPKDWPKIKYKLWQLEQDIFGDNAFEDIEELDTFKNIHGSNYIVKDGKKIIGYLMSQPLTSDIYHPRIKNRNHTWYLESVGLLPAYQGKGHGKTLIHNMLLDAIELGCNKAILDATSDGMVALALKEGFKKKYYNPNHGNTGAWIMIYELGGHK